MDGIGFHFLRRSDFGLLRRWLAEPLVARWWNHDTSTVGLERDFGAAADGNDRTTVLIAEVAAGPFGLIQYYPLAAYPEYLAALASLAPVAGAAVSIDYLIGEPDVRGQRLGKRMVAACLERIWAEPPEASCVLVPVHANNQASWRTLESAGFHRIAEGALRPDNPRDSTDHYVYRCSRPAVGRGLRHPGRRAGSQP